METPTSSSFPGNRLNSYLQLLTKVKKGLPYGQPVCVSPSHTINNTDALLELADLVGPHIALLQVHADIIDDWSHETVRQLISIANKHAFLIWECGRILNATVDIIGRQKSETREVRNELVDLIRKNYSKGLVRPAAWAGLATAWPSGVPVNNQEADILIPTLRNAAREAVAETVKTIRTEITTERPLNGQEESTIVEIDTGSPHLSSDYVVDDSSSELAPRKPSTISLTQTITQHTEDVPGNHQGTSRYERSYNIQRDTESLTISSTGEDLPAPPLYSRGLVLCLPSAVDTSFTADYRRSCIAAADANQDFVLGFVCSEPWQITSQKEEIFDDISLDDEDQLSDEDNLPCLTLFAIIPHQLGVMNGKHVDDLYNEKEDEETIAYTPKASPSQLEPANSVAKRIFYIVREALKSRALSNGKNTTNAYTTTKVMRGRKVLHLPIIAIP
ncbi:uncharacterized protein KD926_006103 [Aspergillus affinis]|uniref:uncharacterized protein n=1 Tax=Aspergillus affinis TaxID=1070780 RepID=UPI0022FE3E04|nr:uncharacterized protein KD926_006103 [Aspergillus affinis]KAI9042184.1 hypothetical protein KD926_006103 [Aspergillus affinis]